MAKPLLPDELWERIQPLLPPRRKPKRSDRLGRPPLEDRKALTGILFVLKTGIDWEDLPQEMGCCQATLKLTPLDDTKTDPPPHICRGGIDGEIRGEFGQPTWTAG